MRVAIYKKSERGYYRWRDGDLVKTLTSHTEDEKIKAYRKTKTKAKPKGDQELKRKIKAYMPSGDYGPGVSRSKNAKLKIETGLVQLDFDITVSRKQVEAVFNKYDIIRVAGISCGGNGFYVLVQTPSAEHYEQYWQALCEYFEEETGYFADPSVSSVNEIRYLSLTTDVFIRDKVRVWKKQKPKTVSRFEGVKCPHNSKLIEAESSNLHYVDLVSLVGLNNSNGTPLEAVQAYVNASMFAKDSHLSRAKKSDLADICERVYNRYAEQHGESIVPLILSEHSVTLPPIEVPKDSTQRYVALLVVKNIFESYMLKTDAKTRITYRFTGTYWQEISDHDLRNFLTACAFASNIDNRIAELKDFRDFMLNQLKDTTAATFDAPLDMFNLNNGVLKFEKGKILFAEHTSEYLFTYILDYDYLPDARSKLLDAFLERTIPDEASLVSLFQYIGSAFSDIRVELFLIILGGGANGKSTLMNLVATCLGGAVGHYNLDTLTDTQSDTAAKEARNIYNKVLAIDTESSRIKDARLWRKIISKEPISIKFLYKDVFESKSYARLISCMNETPFIDTLEGSARRILSIQTGRSLRRDEYDLEIDKKLHKERSAMLNKIIEGYKTFYEQGGVLEISEDSRTQTLEILDEFNLVMQFLKHKRYFLLKEIKDGSTKTTKAEKYEIEHAEHFKKLQRVGISAQIVHVKLSELYQEYRDFCTDEGVLESKIYSKRLFVKRLRTVSGQRLDCSHELGSVHMYLNRDEVVDLYPFGRVVQRAKK
jgi:putative DNA primase/helicase